MKRRPTQPELEEQLHSYYSGTPRLSAPPSLLGVLDQLPDHPAPAPRTVRYPAGLKLAAAGLVAVAVLALIGLPLLMSKSPQVPPVGDSPSAGTSASASVGFPMATSRPSVAPNQSPTQPPPTDTGPSGIYVEYSQSIRADQTGSLTLSSQDTLKCTVVVRSGTVIYQTIDAFNVPARTAQSVSFGVADYYTGIVHLELACSHANEPGRAQDTWDLPVMVNPAHAWSLQATIADTRAADGYSFGYTSSVDAACTLRITYPADTATSVSATSSATFQAAESVPGRIANPIPGSPATGTATWETTCVDGHGNSHVDSGTFGIL